MLLNDRAEPHVWLSVPSPSIENESIAEQDDDDLTKVATGTSHTQKRERRKTDHPKVENIICQSGLNDSTLKLIVARLPRAADTRIVVRRKKVDIVV